MISQHRIHASGGVTLAAEEAGDPAHTSVVFLHGGGQTRHAWRKASTQLTAAGYHTLAYDARGHGDSDWAPDKSYTLDDFVADLHAVLDTLSGRPVLVGASLGGVTSLAAVGEGGGDRTSALVLVDVVPRAEPAGVQHIRDFMTGNPEGFAGLHEAADAVARYNPHRPRPRDPSGLMKNLRRGADGRLYWHWDPAFVSGDMRMEPMAMADRLEAAARQVRIPTLLVRGADSDVVSAEGAERFRALIPGAETVDVPGAGHMVAGDRNNVFNDAILDFLARRRPAG